MALHGRARAVAFTGLFFGGLGLAPTLSPLAFSITGGLLLSALISTDRLLLHLIAIHVRAHVLRGSFTPVEFFDPGSGGVQEGAGSLVKRWRVRLVSNGCERTFETTVVAPPGDESSEDGAAGGEEGEDNSQVRASTSSTTGSGDEDDALKNSKVTVGDIAKYLQLLYLPTEAEAATKRSESIWRAAAAADFAPSTEENPSSSSDHDGKDHVGAGNRSSTSGSSRAPSPQYDEDPMWEVVLEDPGSSSSSASTSASSSTQDEGARDAEDLRKAVLREQLLSRKIYEQRLLDSILHARVDRLSEECKLEALLPTENLPPSESILLSAVKPSQIAYMKRVFSRLRQQALDQGMDPDLHPLQRYLTAPPQEAVLIIPALYHTAGTLLMLCGSLLFLLRREPLA
eukprot:g10327.t1